MSYSPTVYCASMVTPRLLARSADCGAELSASPRRSRIIGTGAGRGAQGSGSKYSTRRGAE